MVLQSPRHNRPDDKVVNKICKLAKKRTKGYDNEGLQLLRPELLIVGVVYDVG